MKADNLYIENAIENLSLQVCMLEEENIPALGKILNILSGLEQELQGCQCIQFFDIIQALKSYLGRMILNEESDLKPLETGMATIQAIWRYIGKGEDFIFDISGDLQELGYFPDDGPDTPSGNGASDNTISTGKTPLSTEDATLLREFIAESRENLEHIELNLLELEQDPENTESINAVFRPFHTIKGVSGFLKLTRMNELCHHTENLIGNVRSGSLVMDPKIADLVLESVDTIQLMLEELERDLDKGVEASLENIDSQRLVEKIIMAATHQEEVEPLGRILVNSGSIKRKDLRDGLKIQKKNPEKKLGKILLEENKTEPDRIQAALKSQANGKHAVNLQVKVDTSKLDNLVDLTGELVISQSMFKKVGLDIAASDQKYFQHLNQVTQAVSAIQKIAMSMRMIPIKNTFQKMFRIVRDLTRNSGKAVDIVLTGEETEIDRNIVDELYEPMVHIIRNSVDHGLETADERKAAGKPSTGTIHLRAGQKGGNIVIEIKDDGRGLDRERIFEKAISCNLAAKDDQLMDKEIYQFIMQPGFSTAREITEISGRGVGMDVVKEGIEKLRGRLEIDSAPGEGTTLTISLPLTLAIMDGMLVKVGKERYILPTHAIIDSFRPEKENCYTVEKKGEMVRHRGSLIPVVRLNQLFCIQGGVSIPWDGIIVIVENNGEKMAILLDELVGKDDFVIKSIGSALKNVQGVAGGSILSDGQVGLIIDMPGLFQMTGIARS